MWRLLTHPHLTVSRKEIEKDWCLDDVKETHIILDAIDDCVSRQAKKNG